MPKRSAGLLLYRRRDVGLEVLLVHPGGPYWAGRDEGAWSIPKGEVEEGEDPVEVAFREFREEVGADPPDGPPVHLGECRQPSGKIVTAWAVEGDADVDTVRSNTFTMQWPPRSGVMRTFPEVDRAGWFDVATAREKLLAGQAPFLRRLTDALG